MEMTKRALGYLKKRYSVVLKKNYMLNTFGALALASAMAVGGAGVAMADDVEISTVTPIEISSNAKAGDTITTSTAAKGDIVVHINNRTLELGTVTIGGATTGGELTVILDKGAGEATAITSGVLSVIGNGNTTQYNVASGLTHTVKGLDSNPFKSPGTLDDTAEGDVVLGNDQSTLNVAGTLNIVDANNAYIQSKDVNGVLSVTGSLNALTTEGGNANLTIAGTAASFDGANAKLSVADLNLIGHTNMTVSGDARLTVDGDMNLYHSDLEVGGDKSSLHINGADGLHMSGGSFVTVVNSATLEANGLDVQGQNGEFGGDRTKLINHGEVNVNGGKIQVSGGNAGLNVDVNTTGGAGEATVSYANNVEKIEVTGGNGFMDAVGEEAGGSATLSVGDGSAGEIIITGGNAAADGTTNASAGGAATLTLDSTDSDKKFKASSITLKSGAEGADPAAKGGVATLEVGNNGVETDSFTLNDGAVNLYGTFRINAESFSIADESLVGGVAAASQIGFTGGKLNISESITVTTGANDVVDFAEEVRIDSYKVNLGADGTSDAELAIGAKIYAHAQLNAGTINTAASSAVELGNDKYAASAGNKGSLNASLAGRGTVSFEGGAWTVADGKSINLDSSLTVGAAASLDVSNLAHDADPSKDAFKVGDAFSNAGTLTINAAEMGVTDADVTKLAANVAAVNAPLNNSGTLVLKGMTGSLDLAGMQTALGYLDSAVTNNGFVTFDGVTVAVDQATDKLQDAAGIAGLEGYTLETDGATPLTGNTKVGAVSGLAINPLDLDGSTLELVGVDGALADGEIDVDGGTLTTGTGTLAGDITATGDRGTLNVKGATVAQAVTVGTANVNTGASLVGKFLVSKSDVTIAGSATFTDVAGVETQLLTVTDKGSLTTTKLVANLDTDIAGAVKASDAVTVVTGNLSVNQGGSLEAKSATVAAGNADIFGTVKITDAFTADGVVTVGNHDKTGILSAGEVAGKFFADPAWDTGLEAATIATGKLTAGATALLTAGQNSTVAVGTTDTMWVQNSMKKAGLSLSETGITAAFGITGAPLVLEAGNHGIKVDGSLSNYDPATAAVADTANFAANSLLVVDAGIASGTDFALKGATINVADSAKLLISDVTLSNGVATVNVADAEAGALAQTADKGWAGDGNIHFDSVFLQGTLDAAALTKNQAVVNVSQVKANTLFPRMDTGLAGLIDTGIVANVDSRGMTFVKEVASLNTSAEERAETMEGAAQMGAVAGIAATSMSVAKAGVNAATLRNTSAGANVKGQEVASLTLNEEGVSAGSASSGMKNGIGIWLSPLYKWTNVSGADAGSFDSGYNAGFGGIAFGTDYTFSDAFRVGVALNLGAGYTESSGSFNNTTSDFDFWGLSLYGAYMKDNFTVMLDAGYTGVYSNVDQDMPLGVSTGNLEADVNSDVWTVGLTAEYVWKTSALDITPHVGVRFMSVSTRGYDVEGSGGDVFSVDQDVQNVWYFPVGVTLSKDVAMKSGWFFTPKLDVGFIAAAGDLEATSSTSLVGVNGSTDLTMKNVDGFAFNGGVGFDIGNENLTLGVNYNILASEHETDHMIFGTFRYDF